MKSSQTKLDFTPIYPFEPIRGLLALSKALGIHRDVLVKYSTRADRLYRLAKQETKADGSIRQTFDAFPVLKAIQTRIQQRILKRIVYPFYLHGSLSGRSPRTNAAIHVKAKIAFAEDISNFFPSVRHELVKNIWSGLLGFSDDVAEVLTLLTTKDSGLPQGAVTSSFLANLVFWDYEPKLVEKLNARGLRYSRYVDDICVSCEKRLSIKNQSLLVSEIYGMLLRYELRPKRSKHEVHTAGKSMFTTKLLCNSRVALPAKHRQNIRAAVFSLEKQVKLGHHGSEIEKELTRITSKVGRLGSFHPKEGTALKARLKIVRQTIVQNAHTLNEKAVLNSETTTLEDNCIPWE